MQSTFNKIILAGTVEDKGTEYKKVEQFTTVVIRTKRKSGTLDEIDVVIPEAIVQDTALVDVGRRIKVVGEIRTRHKGTHKLIYVFATKIETYEGTEDINEADIEGIISAPITCRYRQNERIICDIVLATNRHYGKADYIPAIAWGRTALICSYMEVGEIINVKGRIQSRRYYKQQADGSREEKIAYEVSICQMQKNGNDERANNYDDQELQK